jgi:hypothetical protein
MSLINQVLQCLPRITYGFAYGSGVFRQRGLYAADQAASPVDGPMVDMILVVDDPVAWHAEVGGRHQGASHRRQRCMGDIDARSVPLPPLNTPRPRACRTSRATGSTTRSWGPWVLSG